MGNMAEWQLAGWKGGMLGHVYNEYAGYNLLDFLGHSNFLLSCLLSNGIIVARETRVPSASRLGLRSAFLRSPSEREARSLPLALWTSALPPRIAKRRYRTRRDSSRGGNCRHVSVTWWGCEWGCWKNLLLIASTFTGYTNVGIQFTSFAQGFLCQ